MHDGLGKTARRFYFLCGRCGATRSRSTANPTLRAMAGTKRKTAEAEGSVKKSKTPAKPVPASTMTVGERWWDVLKLEHPSPARDDLYQPLEEWTPPYRNCRRPIDQPIGPLTSPDRPIVHTRPPNPTTHREPLVTSPRCRCPPDPAPPTNASHAPKKTRSKTPAKPPKSARKPTTSKKAVCHRNRRHDRYYPAHRCCHRLGRGPRAAATVLPALINTRARAAGGSELHGFTSVHARAARPTAAALLGSVA